MSYFILAVSLLKIKAKSRLFSRFHSRTGKRERIGKMSLSLHGDNYYTLTQSKENQS